MTVSCRKGQLDWFRKKCKRTPNEIMAFLLGYYCPKKHYAEIDRFVYPAMEVSTPSMTMVNGAETCRIEEMAEDLSLDVLGTLHSHPDALPVLSHTDYQSLFIDNRDLLVGICEVTNGRTEVLFWVKDSPLSCDLVYTKDKK